MMRRRRIWQVLLLLAALLPGAAQAEGAPSVRIGEQILLGVGEADGVASFRGIAYAQPPVGPLRWKAPLRPRDRAGTVDATEFAPACPQGDGNTRWYRRVAEAMGADPAVVSPIARLSEDCLYLNIWTPQPRVGARLPVMVWIHGGSNENGYSYEPNYRGGPLARQGVVVVTIAYRLGLLGFFAHPALGSEKDGAAAGGRQGLLDQIAALRWIRAHIAAFGGDPANVTVFGESAGGTDIALLAAMPQVRGLFARAIIESGYLAPDGVASLPAARKFAAGLFSPAITAEQLHALPWQEILALQDRKLRGHFYTPVAPVPRRSRVPLLIGSNADEYRMYLPADEVGLHAALAEELRGLPRHRRRAVWRWTAQQGGDLAGKVDAVSSGKAFHCPAARMAVATAAGGQAVHLYRFTRVRPGAHGLGAYHGAEIPYVFGTGDDWLPATARDAAVIRQIQQYWMNFARTGRPYGAGLPRWPRSTSRSLAMLPIGSEAASGTPERTALCRLLRP